MQNTINVLSICCYTVQVYLDLFDALDHLIWFTYHIISYKHINNTGFVNSDIKNMKFAPCSVSGKFIPKVQAKLNLTRIQKSLILSFVAHFTTPKMFQKEVQVDQGPLQAA